jgi:predicted transcriptional regulator
MAYDEETLRAEPQMHQDEEEMFAFVKRRLDETRGRWTDAAKYSGVPYDTVKKIAQGKTKDPTVSNVQKLSNYFHRFDAFEASSAKETVSA